MVEDEPPAIDSWLRNKERQVRNTDSCIELAATVPWSDVGLQWRERDYSVLRQAIRRLNAFPLEDVEGLFEGMRPPSDAEARDVLRNAFKAACGSQQGALLFVTYVYGLCLDRWERIADHHRIHIVLAALEGVVAELSDAELSDVELGRDEIDLLRLIVDLAQCMEHEMAVENAWNCSCPIGMAGHAQASVEHAKSVLEREEQLPRSFAGLRNVIRLDAAAHHRYFDAVLQIATAMREFLEHDGPAPAHFDDVIRAVAAAEADEALRGDVYESELRTYRATLEAFAAHAESRRLRIDTADLVYLYPFALSGVSAESAVEQALVTGMQWRPASLEPVEVDQLRLAWVWASRSPERAYEGAAVKLPALQVQTTAGQQLTGFHPEVRLSRLGNHHVRVQYRLEKGDLHELNQALRRASPSMGEEHLSCERLSSDGVTWTKFADYANEVIQGVANELAADVVSGSSLDFHVVIAARAISIQEPNGAITPATVDDIPRVIGASLLLRPVSHDAASFEEWIRYPTPEVANLMEKVGIGYVGELAMRTENTTILFMPASPEWVITAFEEMVEFVASAPALLTSWERRAWDHGKNLEATLPSFNEWLAQPDKVLPIDTLQVEGAKLRQLDADIRRDLAFMHSPGLCRSRGIRNFLDALWEAAGLPALEDDLESQLAVISTLQERLSVMASAIAERSRQKLQARQDDIQFYVQLILGLLAVSSLAELLSWINNTFNISSSPWKWSEAAILVVCALLVTWLFIRMRRAR